MVETGAVFQAAHYGPPGRSSDLGSTRPGAFPMMVIAHRHQWHPARTVPLTALGTSRILTAFPILRRPIAPAAPGGV